MKVIDAKALFKTTGEIIGEGSKHYSKKFKDIKHLYLNSEEKDDELNMYDVYSFGGNGDNENDLYFGCTIMHPIDICGECNFTRGHWHENRTCPEFYFGVKGEGYLLLMDEEGQAVAEKIQPDSIHYIDGNYAHRLVNTGKEDLVVSACWSAGAGHDYDAVDRLPFPERVFRINDEIVFVKRETE